MQQSTDDRVEHPRRLSYASSEDYAEKPFRGYISIRTMRKARFRAQEEVNNSSITSAVQVSNDTSTNVNQEKQFTKILAEKDREIRALQKENDRFEREITRLVHKISSFNEQRTLLRSAVDTLEREKGPMKPSPAGGPAPLFVHHGD